MGVMVDFYVFVVVCNDGKMGAAVTLVLWCFLGMMVVVVVCGSDCNG